MPKRKEKDPSSLTGSTKSVGLPGQAPVKGSAKGYPLALLFSKPKGPFSFTSLLRFLAIQRCVCWEGGQGEVELGYGAF